MIRLDADERELMLPYMTSLTAGWKLSSLAVESSDETLLCFIMTVVSADRGTELPLRTGACTGAKTRLLAGRGLGGGGGDASHLLTNRSFVAGGGAVFLGAATGFGCLLSTPFCTKSMYATRTGVSSTASCLRRFMMFDPSSSSSTFL